MAVLDLNHGAADREGGRVASLKKSIADYFTHRAVYRQTVNELNALTDNELADLGIYRLDINRIAREAVQVRR